MSRLVRPDRVLALALACLAGACSAADDDARAPRPTTPTTVAAAQPVFPGDTWARAEATSAGFDMAALDRLAARVEAAGSSCLVVTRDGAVVDERYWNGADGETPREAFSVTKSVTSILVGIAQDAGLLDLDDPASKFVDEWRGTDAEAVTVLNLLRNDSGRHWDFATDYRDMAILAADKTAFSIGLGQDAPPGEVWAYNNAAIQTLDDVLAAATAEEPTAYAQRVLFERIGMRHSTMTTDAAGNTLMFMGLRTTCLDLARFGYLMLRGGTWEGQQVVSHDYVERATGESSTPLNDGYGLLFWLNRPGRIGSPRLATTGEGGQDTIEGQLAPGAPDDVFWALGFRNQIVAVIPSEGVVAVRMGAAPPPDQPLTHVELTLGVLEAITEP